MGKFKRGDVVKLNSGGPAMTITGVHQDKAAAVYKQANPEGYYDCAWFEHPEDPDQYVHYASFHEDVIQLME